MCKEACLLSDAQIKWMQNDIGTIHGSITAGYKPETTDYSELRKIKIRENLDKDDAF